MIQAWSKFRLDLDERLKRARTAFAWMLCQLGCYGALLLMGCGWLDAWRQWVA